MTQESNVNTVENVTFEAMPESNYVKPMRMRFVHVRYWRRLRALTHLVHTEWTRSRVGHVIDAQLGRVHLSRYVARIASLCTTVPTERLRDHRQRQESTTHDRPNEQCQLDGSGRRTRTHA
jgi:hypothetical protein